MAPPAPSVAAPVATAPGAPRPPAPTIPLRTAGAASPAAPAPTIKLATSAAPIGPAPTIALKTAGGSPALPKATVQLTAPTQPVASSSPSQMATLPVDDDEDDSAGSPLVNGLSIVGFVAALALLAFQIMIANVWISKDDPTTQDRAGEWARLFE